MRRAMIAILMAATAATPLAAQDNWRGRNHDGGEQRSQRVEQRAEAHQQRQENRQVQQAQPQQRIERQQAENRGNRGGRSFQQQQVQQQQVQQQAVQAQQQQVRAERFQGRGGGDRGGNWNGNRQQDNATRFAAEREASRRSAEQTIGGSFARQAAENERRYEQQTLRREQRDGRSWNGNRNDNRRWDGNRNDGRSWNRSWRNDNRYDWQRYRYQNRRIFSPGRYYAPYGGYGYSRLNIGIILGEAFFGRNYWIDPVYYHLPPAPPGTEWVRYYNDVVLVDIYSGEVLDTIYDFFW